MRGETLMPRMPTKPHVALSRLHELFILVEGTLYRRTTRGNKPKFGQVGTLRKDGYWMVGVDRVIYPVHRLIYVMHHGRWPSLLVDHIDGNPGNNDPTNLREVSAQQNQWNLKLNSRNTSGHRGVSWNKSLRKWEAYLRFDGRRHRLGQYDDVKEAAEAVRMKVISVRGEYSPELSRSTTNDTISETSNG
jgi:hypothetical protein